MAVTFEGGRDVKIFTFSVCSFSRLDGYCHLSRLVHLECLTNTVLGKEEFQKEPYFPREL